MATLQWTLDPAHSEAQFKVRHMGVSNVSGEFKTFDVTFTSEDSDFLTAKATFTAPIDSISTGVEHRDNHLKSDDFFDAIHHPTIFFESTQFSDFCVADACFGISQLRESFAFRLVQASRCRQRRPRDGKEQWQPCDAIDVIA